MRPPGLATRKEQDNASDKLAEGRASQADPAWEMLDEKTGECNFGTNSDRRAGLRVIVSHRGASEKHAETH